MINPHGWQSISKVEIPNIDLQTSSLEEVERLFYIFDNQMTYYNNDQIAGRCFSLDCTPFFIHSFSRGFSISFRVEPIVADQ